MQFLIKKKAFSNGEVVKEAMMLIAKIVLEDEKYGTDVISNLSDVQLGVVGKKSIYDVWELG